MSVFWLLMGCSSDQETLVDPRPAGQNQSVNISQHPPHPPQNGSAAHSPRGGQGGLPPKGPSLKAEPTYELIGELSAEPHSLILISMDTVSAERLEVYGGRAKAPGLMSLASAGTVFEQAISQFPETALSHWSMMSGVFPEVHGNVPGNGGSQYKGPTLAELAKKHGYATAAFIGGVTMTDQASGFSRGFDVYDDQFTFDHRDMSRAGSVVTQRALQWVSRQDRPFFAFVHYFDAHFPYTPDNPAMYDSSYQGPLDGSDAKLRPYRDGKLQPSKRDVEHILALYDAEITELDADLSPLLALAGPQTVVLVTADHGESFSHGYYFNHRAGLWDEIVRVPWIMAGGRIKAQRISEQVGLIDLFPTVTALIGLPSDRRVQGRDVLAEAESTAQISITDPWMPNSQRAIRTDRWKWIDAPDGQSHLYDHASDPTESKELSLSDVPSRLKTVSREYAADVKALSAHLVPEPKHRSISKEECARLEALGYTTCQK